MREHCCALMTTHANHQCDLHPDPFDCPDHLIHYAPHLDEYGIIIHDGGSSVIGIQFCLWCGARLPVSRRDQWFEELEAAGFDDPLVQEIPAAYRTDAWYRERSA